MRGSPNSWNLKRLSHRQAILSVDIQHPNLVRSIKYATRMVRGGVRGSEPVAAMHKSLAVSDDDVGLPVAEDEELGDTPRAVTERLRTPMSSQGPKVQEVWIMMEYCEMGTLDAAVLNGLFEREPERQVDLRKVGRS